MSKSRSYQKYTEVDLIVECCDHCHGDEDDCKADTGADAIDLIDRYLSGLADRSELIRFAQKNRLRSAVLR